MSETRQPGCPLCQEAGGLLLASGDRVRVIRVNPASEPAAADFPVFYRVVWQAHAAEFSDLSASERQHCMEVVAAVEGVIRTHLPEGLRPDKLNLAALGNMVPHLHWHVVGRYRGDSHFPSPIWAAATRSADAALLASLGAALPALDAAMRQALQPLGLT